MRTAAYCSAFAPSFARACGTAVGRSAGLRLNSLLGRSFLPVGNPRGHHVRRPHCCPLAGDLQVLLSLMWFASFDALCVAGQELIGKKWVSATFSRCTSQDGSCWLVSRESFRELRARRSSRQRSLGPGAKGDAPPRVGVFIHISCHTKGYEDNVHAVPLLVRDGAA